MPRTAQPGTTNSLRRLAGRRTNVVGGPHLPLHSSEEPPVLFRLPEISLAAHIHHETASASDSATAAVKPLPLSSEPAVVSSVKHDLEESGQNVFNHVAGAVTGAVAGTVANGVAIAGSALSATPLGGVSSVKPSFASASASLHPNFGPTESYPIAQPTTHHRSTAEAAETETRSWWEHWSSGIILMLLILALVTAGIMAIRDPKRTLNTNRSIADETEENVSSMNSNESGAPSRSSTDTANKPTLADNADVTVPPSSASLGPTLLPDPSTAVETNSDSDPALSPTRIFTLNRKDSTSTEDPSTSDSSAEMANSQSFVSSAKASPSSPASSNPFAASDSSGNSTPTIPASTPINNTVNANQFRNDQADTKFPAVPNSNTPSNYDLTWPVEDTDSTGTTTQENNQSANRAAESNPASPTLKLTEADSLEPNINSDDANVASNPMNGSASSSGSPKAAYLETALPNEDLESILAMRRNAISSGRMVSNQYYPSNTSAEATTSMPYQTSMPNAAATMTNASNQNIPAQMNPAQMNPAPYYPMTPNPNLPQINTNIPNATNAATGYAPQQYAAPTGPATNWQNNPQTVGARSFTYQPNTAPVNNMTQPTNTLQMSNTFSGAMAPGNYQLDPRMAQQLGYAPQPTATAPSPNTTTTTTTPGWWNNTPATNKPATTSRPNYAAPNIVAPSMQPNAPQPNTVPQAQMPTTGGYLVPGNAPTTQQPYYPPNSVQPTGMPAGYPQ